ncbi:hypothetical protein PFICI_02527 [Pestalotiopsis fici W106-1]|uniref:ATP-dependent DNA helicase n=1 Tax=Pestalotiopsis fici (strain W106-1 / CGMCC3.15140) TaxID=1229662 RepID=W3XGE2_PESFW|nr:uncharacterized protein PFICI_02527 [Pestalotiopsis fici W106-1]ETS84502.1 hypothetical protein PFICI_02527 [Pestalotiopsis fici W106-1]
MADNCFSYDVSRPSRKRAAAGESASQPIVLIDSDEEEAAGEAFTVPAPKRHRVEQSLPEFIPLDISDDENIFHGASNLHRGRDLDAQSAPNASKHKRPHPRGDQHNSSRNAPLNPSMDERIDKMITEWTRDMSAGAKKYYVALKARQPGIFTTWPECEAQVKGIAGWNGKTMYRTCSSLQEARNFARENLPNVLQEQDSRQERVNDQYNRPERDTVRSFRAEISVSNQPSEISNGQNRLKQGHSHRNGHDLTQSGIADSRPAISRGGLSAPQQSISVKVDSGELGDADGNVEFDVADDEPELCKEQQEAVNHALSGRNVFMTGSGGCGKSVVVRHLLKKFRAEDKNVSIVAPTGIAAFQVSGSTTCTFMGWTQDTCREPFEQVRKNLWKKKTAKRLKSTDVLIIDEISMVSNFHFERMSRAFTEIKGYRNQENLEPFGGCQVIAVGDFCQLPPINGLEFCNDCGMKMTKSTGRSTTYTCPECPRPIAYTEQDKWAFKSEAWADCNFANVHLTKIHRQSDEKFVQMLQKGRLGRKLVQAEIDLLMNHPCNVENGVWLSSRRKEVTDRNESEFAKINSEQFDYWCIDKFDCAHDDLRGTVNPVYWGKPPMERRPLDKLSEHRYSNCLSLKVGMPVILLKNVDVQAGLCNGSQGIVVGFEDYQKAAPPTPPNDSNYEGDEEGYRRAHRRWSETTNFMKHPGLDKQVLPVVQFHNGMRCMIQPDCTISQLSAAEGRYSLLLRTQIPLAQGWALTIHKSQGMTLERLVVNLASVFEHGQAYVALSRATALEGLKIEGGPSATNALRNKLGPPQEVMEFLHEKFPHMFQS